MHYVIHALFWYMYLIYTILVMLYSCMYLMSSIGGGLFAESQKINEYLSYTDYGVMVYTYQRQHIYHIYKKYPFPRSYFCAYLYVSCIGI